MSSTLNPNTSTCRLTRLISCSGPEAYDRDVTSTEQLCRQFPRMISEKSILIRSLLTAQLIKAVKDEHDSGTCRLLYVFYDLLP